jgi:hypothetical protein
MAYAVSGRRLPPPAAAVSRRRLLLPFYSGNAWSWYMALSIGGGCSPACPNQRS